MENKNPTQVERVKNFMEQNGSINPIEALNELGIMRLASRIAELRKEKEVVSEMVTVMNRYGEKCRVARYRFVEE